MVMLPPMTYAQYSTVYNATSFVMASMGASTVYFFFHSQMVHDHYKTALCISALVTLIAFYHYFRIFNSWVDAFSFEQSEESHGEYVPKRTGEPFNDAYRYMDWLLTVPLLLIELILVMNMDDASTRSYSWRLGFVSALMILVGYPGEVSNSHSERWMCWTVSMVFFLYIIYTLFVGLAASVQSQPESVRELVSNARWVTVLSWCTYPFVYIIPMFGVSGPTAVVGIQVGYSISDFISKCGLGLMITKIALQKSKEEGSGVQGAGLLRRD